MATTSRSSSSSTAICGARTPRRSPASRNRPRRRCCGRAVVFHAFKNNAVESAFADQRTYIYKGKEVDKQVHLGFDLASFAGTPIVAANRGKVLFADELGIYGNCVIIDHGMGVQSLYAHLSSIEVKAGQDVEKEQTLGRSGMTGLAGGDHLHFTMLLQPPHDQSCRVVGRALDRGIRSCASFAAPRRGRQLGPRITPATDYTDYTDLCRSCPLTAFIARSLWFYRRPSWQRHAAGIAEPSHDGSPTRRQARRIPRRWVM